jgi:hypothetical protein
MESFSSLFDFCFGFCTALYVFVYMYSGNGKDSTANQDNNKDNSVKFYINLFFFNRKEVIENIIRSKVPKSRPLLRALAKRLAVQLLSRDIVEKIGQSLCALIPTRLQCIGVKSVANIAYTQAGFICLEISLQGVDLLTLAGKKGDSAKDAKISSFLRVMTSLQLDSQLGRFVLKLLVPKLISQFPITVKEKLQMKFNAEIEIVCCQEEEQGPFIMTALQALTNSPTSATMPPVTTTVAPPAPRGSSNENETNMSAAI